MKNVRNKRHKGGILSCQLCAVGVARTHQHFAVDTLGQGQPLEDLAEQLEHLSRVLGLDLSFKPIHLVHVVRLVVT